MNEGGSEKGVFHPQITQIFTDYLKENLRNLWISKDRPLNVNRHYSDIALVKHAGEIVP